MEKIFDRVVKDFHLMLYAQICDHQTITSKKLVTHHFNIRGAGRMRHSTPREKIYQRSFCWELTNQISVSRPLLEGVVDLLGLTTEPNDVVLELYFKNLWAKLLEISPVVIAQHVDDVPLPMFTPEDIRAYMVLRRAYGAH